MQRGLHIEHIYHRAKFECSSFSSLANTGGGGAKRPPSGTTRDKKVRWNRIKSLALSFQVMLSNNFLRFSCIQHVKLIVS